MPIKWIFFKIFKGNFIKLYITMFTYSENSNEMINSLEKSIP